MGSRAYLRLDPLLRRKKADYPDAALAAYVLVLCAAEGQPRRGRFESAAILRAFLGKRARQTAYLLQRRDLIPAEEHRCPNCPKDDPAPGELYVDGWDEWQEGDWTVSDRVARIRNKHRADTDGVTPDVTPAVTEPVTEFRIAEAEATALAEASQLDGQPLADPDAATFACRFLPDGGRWLANREYTAAWDDIERRYSDWVKPAIQAAYTELIGRGKGARAWDLKRLTELRLAERIRQEERKATLQRQASEAREARAAQEVGELTPEERERQALMRRAVKLWAKGGIRDAVPESVEGLRDWLAAHDPVVEASA
jgi:hypothetical protein